MKKLFVWDFHGTLEKGNELAALEVSNKALQKHGYQQRFNEKDAIKLYGKKWYEYFEYLLPEEDHQVHIDLQQTSFDWPDTERIIAKYMLPNDHAIEVISTIKNAGHEQILLSNTNLKALPVFIRLANLSEFFDETNAFAVMAHSREAKRTKQDVLGDYLKTSIAKDIIVIGDSINDMKLAEFAGAKGYMYKHKGLKFPDDIGSHIFCINDLRKVLSQV
jgi:phosphoglycolate phosphatase-like HAD superfamily hydrolase